MDHRLCYRQRLLQVLHSVTIRDRFVASRSEDSLQMRSWMDLCTRPSTNGHQRSPSLLNPGVSEMIISSDQRSCVHRCGRGHRTFTRSATWRTLLISICCMLVCGINVSAQQYLPTFGVLTAADADNDTALVYSLASSRDDFPFEVCHIVWTMLYQ